MTYSATHARFENNPARQAAYRLWRDSPSSPVTDLLPALELEIGEKLAVRTVQNWRQIDKWDVRLAVERLADAEVSIPRAWEKLRVAAPDAFTYLHDVSAGVVPGDALRIKASQIIVQEFRSHVELTRDQRTVEAEAAFSISEPELLALETPWTPEEQGAETPE